MRKGFGLLLLILVVIFLALQMGFADAAQKPIVEVFDENITTVILFGAGLRGDEKIEACGKVMSAVWTPEADGRLKTTIVIENCDAFTLYWVDQQWIDSSQSWDVDPGDSGWMRRVVAAPAPTPKLIIYIPFLSR